MDPPTTSIPSQRPVKPSPRPADLAAAEDLPKHHPGGKRRNRGRRDTRPIEYRHQARVVAGYFEYTNRLHPYTAGSSSATAHGGLFVTVVRRPGATAPTAPERVRHRCDRDDRL